MESQLIKFRLPDNRTVDIAADVADQMKKWRQIRRYMSEAGGFLTGYQDERSSNVIIDGLSHPFYLDYRTRTRFDIRDPRHQLFLHKQKRTGSQYVGTWHTHPEKVPEPSERDWIDWRNSLEEDKSICHWMFFAIVGTAGMRIWAGSQMQHEIEELFEVEKQDGIYMVRTDWKEIE